MGEQAHEGLPLSRRAVLGLGAGAAAGWLLSGPFAADSAQAAADNALVEPEILRSSNGLLEVTLVCELRETVVAGQKVRTYTYNGRVPGPTLMVFPGDTIKLRLVNKLAETTNLHTHGL